MIGADAPVIQGQEVARGQGWRMDVENPAPGKRPGQLHLQDYIGNKWMYDFEGGFFRGVPKKLLKSLTTDPRFAAGIDKGFRYLKFGKYSEGGM